MKRILRTAALPLLLAGAAYGGSCMDSTATETSFFAGGYNATSESLGFRLVLVP